jgi:hypothetical protein
MADNDLWDQARTDIFVIGLIIVLFSLFMLAVCESAKHDEEMQAAGFRWICRETCVVPVSIKPLIMGRQPCACAWTKQP